MYNETIVDIFKASCKANSKKKALHYKNKILNYQEVFDKVSLFAQHLCEHGVKKGSRVAVLCDNSIEAVLSYFSVLLSGAVEVAINPSLESVDRVVFALKDSGVTTLIWQSKNKKLLETILDRITSIKSVYVGSSFEIEKKHDKVSFYLKNIFSQKLGSFNFPTINRDDLAIIAYTSGTTEKPKGVMLTHYSLYSVATSLKNFNIKEDKCCIFIPLYHIFAKTFLNNRFYLGSTIVLAENLVFGTELLKLIKDLNITGIVSVPTVLKLIYNSFIQTGNLGVLSSVEYIRSGGASIDATLVKNMQEIFVNAYIVNGYGLTEAGPKVSSLLISPGAKLSKRELESCGTVYEGDEIAIVDEKGDKVSTGVKGEIVFKGKGVMKGYWNNPDETAKVLRESFLYTGDIGYLDEKGYLFIVDRKKDIIKSCGELISSVEIESYINAHDSVHESAVVGIKDDLMGEKIQAFIVLKKGRDMQVKEIIEFCSKGLPFIKVPREIKFVSSLPKTSSGKTKKFILKREC